MILRFFCYSRLFVLIPLRNKFCAVDMRAVKIM